MRDTFSGRFFSAICGCCADDLVIALRAASLSQYLPSVQVKTRTGCCRITILTTASWCGSFDGRALGHTLALSRATTSFSRNPLSPSSSAAEHYLTARCAGGERGHHAVSASARALSSRSALLDTAQGFAPIILQGCPAPRSLALCMHVPYPRKLPRSERCRAGRLVVGLPSKFLPGRSTNTQVGMRWPRERARC